MRIDIDDPATHSIAINTRVLDARGGVVEHVKWLDTVTREIGVHLPTEKGLVVVDEQLPVYAVSARGLAYQIGDGEMVPL